MPGGGIHTGKKVGWMRVLEAPDKIVGAGQGGAGGVITTPISKTADQALLYDGIDPV
jgi:hypothetical protein